QVVAAFLEELEQPDELLVLTVSPDDEQAQELGGQVAEFFLPMLESRTSDLLPPLGELTA
ncbi:MAG TPA: hypothetical protein VGH89_03695, partial [Pseudonocardia sp.]